MKISVRRLWGPPADGGALPVGYRRPLYAVLALAFVLRFTLALLSPSIHQADEVYQVAEQANLAVHGYGIESWEFRAAARSALYPAMVTPVFWLDAGAAVRQTLVAALFTLLSLIPVAVAFRWAAGLFGVRGGLVAAVMMGSWFELVYFAPKPTADAVSSYFFLAALYLARPAASARGVFAAAFLLLATLALRMQIAPAVGLVFLLAMVVEWRARLMLLVAGALVAILLTGIIEWGWWGLPFLGQYNYLKLEFTRDVSSHFGRAPFTFFAKNSVLIYGAMLPLIVVLAWHGAKQAPVLLVAAIALALPFHLIPHKEYRFLIVAVPPVVLLMGLAAADLVTRTPALATSRAMTVAAITWIAAMAAISLGDAYRPNWVRDRNHIRAFREIGARPDACGVALVGIRWFHTPGYSGLGRDVPIYETGRDPLTPRLAEAANYVLVGHKMPLPDAPYVRLQTYSRPEEYLYWRPGPCTPDPLKRITNPDPIPGG